ncbi:MAG: extracellular solute-binding protein [Clostridia bacterium]|nr:extracellular solute-binding protein [Clostridia bacterium]
MKKLFALFLALCLLTASVSAVAETITLKISHNYDFLTIPNSVIEAGKRLNEKYAAEGKDIVIEFETDFQRIDWSEYTQNLIFAYKNGDCPDIFSTNDVPAMVNVGMLLDLTELVTDDYVDGSWDSFKVGEGYYSVPFDLPVRCMYYNRSVLAKYGWSEEEIDALPGKVLAGEFSFEDFLQLCEDVKNAGACTWGLLHRPGAGMDFLDVLEVLGGRYYDENGTLVFDETGITRFFQYIYDAANVTCITPHDCNQMGWNAIDTMMGDATCFAYYGPVFASTYMADIVGITAEQWGENADFILFPVSQYNDKPFAVAGPQGMSIKADTQYPEICKALMRELATDSVDLLAHHASETWSLSSVKAANDTEEVKNSPILKNLLDMPEYTKTIPSIVGLDAYRLELHAKIVQLELGTITPEQAVSEMKTQMMLNLDDDEIIFE